MTTDILHKSFKAEIDKWDSISSHPSFTHSEIDYWLNSAKDRIIKTRISGMNMHRKGLEQSQKRIDDLRTLHVNKIYQADTLARDTYAADIEYIDIEYPTDYMALTGTSVIIKIGDKTYFVDPIELTTDNIDFTLNNSLSDIRLRNEKARPGQLQLDNKIKILFADYYTIETIMISYIRKSLPIEYSELHKNDLLTDLADHLWQEIIIESAKLALLNISDDRYSAYYQESQIVE